MPLRRIFSEQPLRSGATVTIGGDAANHILRVLRLRTGDSLVIFDGSGIDYECAITRPDRDEVTVMVGAGHEVRTESRLEITLLQGVCRGPRMDTVIQKATELGVTRIQPVLAERSVVRLDDDQAGRKQEHWRRVAVAACEQSGRSHVPEIGEPGKLEDILPATAHLATRWLLHPDATGIGDNSSPASPLGLLVGPEGGLTDSERRLAVDLGFTAIRLGPRILRTETAPLAALAILQFVAGDMS